MDEPDRWEWERWIDELEDHPLDQFEYAEALASRSRLDATLELAGADALWERADEADARFEALTIEDPSSPFARTNQPGWWVEPGPGVRRTPPLPLATELRSLTD